ncbi:MAG TPA: TIGR02587 family membrane protein, partial [Candidatus Saccharimonadales bacterium]|nr:TIGR02587 family membrane protein [Candidatus Saccharimonadales bacterium]
CELRVSHLTFDKLELKLTNTQQSPAKTELRHLMHELAGAFLFGMPFLYTMEIWWRGNTAGPSRMLAALALTFIALVVLERAAMARFNRSVPWLRILIEATQALATGLIAAAVGLFLIGFLETDAGLHAITGRLCMEGLPFSLGVGLADFILGEKEEGHEKGEAGKSAEHKKTGDMRERVAVRTGATALGATVIALTLAPTEEIPLIASRLSYPHLLGIVAASLVISYMIVFASNFVATEARRAHRGGFDAPVVETTLSYIVSLVMAGGMLWLYQLIDLNDSPDLLASYIVVLGLPASVGGAAGRLAL